MEEGELVWIPDRQSEAVVQEEVAPQSYNVSIPDGTVRRNRRDQIQMPESSEERVQESDETKSEPPVRRSTRVSRPLERLDPSWT